MTEQDSIFTSMFDDVTDPNKTNKEVVEAYKNWDYEKITVQLAPRRTLIAGEEFEALYRNKKDIMILDAGAGTGLVAVELQKRGFTNMDALDPSDHLLQKARDRRLYNRYFIEYLGTNILPIPDNEYDAILSVGGFAPGHINDSCFEELLRVVKPGGNIMIVAGETYFDDPYLANFEPHAEQLEREGKWIRRMRKVVPGYSYYDNHFVNGLVIVFQKL